MDRHPIARGFEEVYIGRVCASAYVRVCVGATPSSVHLYPSLRVRRQRVHDADECSVCVCVCVRLCICVCVYPSDAAATSEGGSGQGEEGRGEEDAEGGSRPNPSV
eukprot:GHVU01102510.1.p3 GENE.GHVU01102510.1~~GHVU01102510.1.p3  ORF type:complete len:106 (+),score=7.51 GHVU01102510.1:184-501(+)